jgi:hypothetical protein
MLPQESSELFMRKVSVLHSESKHSLFVQISQPVECFLEHVNRCEGDSHSYIRYPIYLFVVSLSVLRHFLILSFVINVPRGTVKRNAIKHNPKPAPKVP